jgi:hypothetical protein
MPQIEINKDTQDAVRLAQSFDQSDQQMAGTLRRQATEAARLTRAKLVTLLNSDGNDVVAAMATKHAAGKAFITPSLPPNAPEIPDFPAA